MSIYMCWYCHWGWSEPVAAIYEKALNDLEGEDSTLLYGPAHIVWADENWDQAQSCLDDWDELIESYSSDGMGPFKSEDLEIVKRSLQELIALPQDQVEIEPDDYDGMNPKNYPPKVPTRRV